MQWWRGVRHCGVSWGFWLLIVIKNHSYCKHVQFILCFLLGNSPASELYMPTFRNTLSVPSSWANRYEKWLGFRMLGYTPTFSTRHSSYLFAYEDGTDRVFRNVGIYNSEAGELPKKYIMYSEQGESLNSIIYSSAHHLCKMWIFYEPRTVTLGNTRYFVEEWTKMVRESLKI